MKKTSLTLMVFTLMSFVLAMIAFVFGGILDKVAVSMNISVANSGLLNTMYGYGAAFGVPITLILFRKIERIRMLKISLGLTILATVALVFAQNFGQLLVVRLIMGVSANSYGVLAISTVLSLSAKERQGRAMAFLIMGSALAMVIGIPLTRALSDNLEWRSIFWMLGGLMALSLIYFQFHLPHGDHESTKLNLKTEWAFLKDAKTLLIIAYTLVMFVGYGAFNTYVTPYFLQLFPAMEPMMSLILVLIGVACFTGNAIGGHVSDRIGYVKSMALGAVLQLVLLLLILVFQHQPWLSLLFTLLWVMSGWFTGLQLNTGIAQATQNKSSFLISLNSSAIQLGSAIGSSLAAVVISLGGMQNIVLVAVVTSLAITVIQLVSMRKTHESIPVNQQPNL